MNKILSAIRLDQLSFKKRKKKKAQQLYLWRLYPFINDFIDIRKSVLGQKVLSSVGLNVRTLISKDVGCELQLVLWW